jgi:hypothetical protein
MDVVIQCSLETALATAPQVDGVVIQFPHGDALCVARWLTDECDDINDATQDTNVYVMTNDVRVEDLRDMFIKLRDGASQLTADELRAAKAVWCFPLMEWARVAQL